MKLPKVLSLLTWVASVIAGAPSGGYERLYYWSIYQAEITVWGNDRHGSCNFNQFINWISDLDINAHTYFDGNPSLTNHDDLERASAAVSEAIDRGDIGNVFPRLVHRSATGWFNLWGSVARSTYALKQDLTNRNLDVNAVVGVELDAADYNLDSTRAVRQGEHNEKLKQYFANVYPDLDVVWTEKTVNSVTFQEVSVDETFAQNEGGNYSRANIVEAIDNFNNGTDEDKNHWDIIQKVSRTKNSCSV
ncbi:hypothetical protein F4679DRAFT_593474 [Xylaria curta]|nr:hypothetical protein F4679DRAFT_593474 [Xylaria curta]